MQPNNSEGTLCAHCGEVCARKIQESSTAFSVLLGIWISQFRLPGCVPELQGASSYLFLYDLKRLLFTMMDTTMGVSLLR